MKFMLVIGVIGIARDGRMVFWGVTAEEGKALCDSARGEMAKRYTGRLECVAGKLE